MAAVTLTTLRARARSRADMPVAGFIADDANGIDAWINEGVQKLHEMLIKAYGAQFIDATVAAPLVLNQTDYALPADMVALWGVSITVNGLAYSLRPYPRTEANYYFNSGASDAYTQKPRYGIVGMAPGVLRLLPTPTQAGNLVINYAPSAVLLTSPANSINFPNGWERYVVVYTAIQMLMKEESDVRELRTELGKMENDLDVIADHRNADQPYSAVDMEAVDADFS